MSAFLLKGTVVQALILAIVLTAIVFWNIGNGVILRGALNSMDEIYAALDELFEEDSPRPQTPLKTGSLASFVKRHGIVAELSP